MALKLHEAAGKTLGARIVMNKFLAAMVTVLALMSSDTYACKGACDRIGNIERKTANWQAAANAKAANGINASRMQARIDKNLARMNGYIAMGRKQGDIINRDGSLAD
jgi:hypothetical protein